MVGGQPGLSQPARFAAPFLRKNHAVDHVDDAVVGHDVSLDDLGLVNHHAACGGHRQFRALHGFDFAHFDVSRHHLAWHHVVGQHGSELGFVFEQGVQIGFWNLGKCLVRGRKHGKRARAFQGVDQTSSRQGSSQRFEAARPNGGINNVFGLNGKHSAERQNGRDEGLFHENLQKVLLQYFRQKCGVVGI